MDRFAERRKGRKREDDSLVLTRTAGDAACHPSCRDRSLHNSASTAEPGEGGTTPA